VLVDGADQAAQKRNCVTPGTPAGRCRVLVFTLLKQDYQLKQVKYELAQLRRARGEVADDGVERARSAYADATRRFQLFWDTRRPID
jgi:hypothetical protein